MNHEASKAICEICEKILADGEAKGSLLEKIELIYSIARYQTDVRTGAEKVG